MFVVTAVVVVVVDNVAGVEEICSLVELQVELTSQAGRGKSLRAGGSS